MNSWIIRSLVFLIILVLSSVAGAADSVNEAMQKGKACHTKKDHDGAMSAYTEAIRLDPKRYGAYGLRGTNYAIKGELDKAIADFTQAFRLNPNPASPGPKSWATSFHTSALDIFSTSRQHQLFRRVPCYAADASLFRVPVTTKNR